MLAIVMVAFLNCASVTGPQFIPGMLLTTTYQYSSTVETLLYRNFKHEYRGWLLVNTGFFVTHTGGGIIGTGQRWDSGWYAQCETSPRSVFNGYLPKIYKWEQFENTDPPEGMIEWIKEVGLNKLLN